MVIKKKKRQKSLINNLKGGFLFTIAVLLMAGIMVFNHQSKNERLLTGKDFCRSDFIPEVTAILVDHTDRFTPLQQEVLRKSLQETALAVKKSGMVQLYSVDDIQKSVLHPEFSLCNPGDDQDLENKLGRRASTVRKNYEDTFIKNLEDNLNKVLMDKTAHESPIMESIQSVTVTSFAGKSKEASKKKLIVVSDLLEHSDKFSLYRGVPDFSEYKKSTHWPSVRSDMRGVDVDIFFLHREGEEKLQTRKLETFWQLYFLEQGAAQVKFVMVEG